MTETPKTATKTDNGEPQKRVWTPMPDTVRQWLRDNNLRIVNSFEANVMLSKAITVYCAQEDNPQYRFSTIRLARRILSGTAYDRFLVELAGLKAKESPKKSVFEIFNEMEKARQEKKRNAEA